MKVSIRAVPYNDGHHYGCVYEEDLPNYRKRMSISVDCNSPIKLWSANDALNATIQFVQEQGWEYSIDTTNDNVEEVKP